MNILTSIRKKNEEKVIFKYDAGNFNPNPGYDIFNE